MPELQHKRFLTTVVNAFQILEVIKNRDGATATELAGSFDISKSTLYDYLATLYALEYIVKDGDVYQISLKSLDHGTYARDNVPLVEHAQSPLEQLATDTNQVAWLYIEEHGHVVYLSVAEGENAVRTRGRIGMRTYMHCTAAGKAILAHFPTGQVREVIDRHGLPRLTQETITDSETLFRELDEIRERGYSFNVGESMEGARAVAAPILIDESPVGAVNVVGASNRLKGSRFDTTLPEQVLSAANDIELNVRYQ